MPKIDKRVDAYIAKSADFAQPILKHFRKLIHQASPEVEETIKWSSLVSITKGRSAVWPHLNSTALLVYGKQH